MKGGGVQRHLAVIAATEEAARLGNWAAKRCESDCLT